MTKRLIFIRLRSFFSSFLRKKKDGTAKISKGKLILISAVFGYVGLTLAGLFTLYSYLVGSVMLPFGLEETYLGAFMTIDFAVIFLLSIFEMKSQLFECKDNELLLSMPIPPKSIVASRVTVVLLLNIIESIIFMAPAVVVFAVLGGSVRGIVGGALAIFLVPLLSVALSSGVGCLLAIVARKMKRMAVLRALIGVAAIMLFYKLYFGIFNVEDEMIGENLAEMLNNPYMRTVGLAAILDPAAFPVFAAVSVGSAALAYFIITKRYISIVTANYSAKRAEYNGRVGRSRSPLVALSVKELKRYASSSGYILNSSLGLAFMALIAVGGLIYSDDISVTVNEVAGILGVNSVLPVLFVAAGVTCLSLNTASASALSLEGQGLWIIKSMPVCGRIVLLSKCAPHVIVSLPFALGFGICASIASGATSLEWVLIIAISVLSVFLFAFVGIIMNTLFPKFKFDNIIQPIKQSGSVFFSILVSFVISISALLLGVVLCSVSSAVALSAMLALVLLLTVGAFALTVTACAKRYERLDA